MVGQPKVTIIIVYYAILLVVLFGLKNIRTKYTRAEKERNIIKKETGLVLEKKAKTLSIPETETRCFVTFDASTFAATSVYMASVNLFPECLWLFLTHRVRPECHGVRV